MRKRFLWLVAVVCLAACGAASGQVSHSGIAGRVVAGPTCPVEPAPPASRCAPRPLVARLRIRKQGGTGHGQVVRSGSDGRFRVALAPGRYVITPLAQPGSPLPRPPAPQDVTVRPDRFTHVQIEYDTGIR